MDSFLSLPWSTFQLILIQGEYLQEAGQGQVRLGVKAQDFFKLFVCSYSHSSTIETNLMIVWREKCENACFPSMNWGWPPLFFLFSTLCTNANSPVVLHYTSTSFDLLAL